jgi:acetolactate synthase small subunit
LKLIQIFLKVLKVEKEHILDWATQEFHWKDVMTTKKHLTDIITENSDKIADIFKTLKPSEIT